MISFYESLFTSSHPTDMHRVLEAVEPKVTSDMNQELIKDFTREEVDLALKHMEPLTAPARMVCLLYFSNLFGLWWVMMLLMLCLTVLIIVISHMILIILL